ncbi:MAG: PDZ domain-containing protein [Planctomycetota bacterium]|nr:PDZ domain-containing protein [Planctomycetota bacterium]
MNILLILPLLFSGIPPESPGPREWSIPDLIQEIGSRIDREFVYETGRLNKKRITMPALSPEASKEDLTRIFERALQVSGLVMVPPHEPKDPWSVDLASIAVKLPLPVINPSEKIPAGYGMYTKIFAPKNISPRNLHAALINKVTFPQGIQVVQHSGILIITDYASSLRGLAKLIELADKHASSVTPLPDRPARPAKNNSGAKLLLSNPTNQVWVMDREDLRKNLKDISGQVRQTCTLSSSDKGVRVVVVNIKPGSTSFTQALKPDDLILTLNGQAIKNEEDFKKVSPDSAKSITLVVERAGKKLSIEFRTFDTEK